MTRGCTLDCFRSPSSTSLCPHRPCPGWSQLVCGRLISLKGAAVFWNVLAPDRPLCNGVECHGGLSLGSELHLNQHHAPHTSHPTPSPSTPSLILAPVGAAFGPWCPHASGTNITVTCFFPFCKGQIPDQLSLGPSYSHTGLNWVRCASESPSGPGSAPRAMLSPRPGAEIKAPMAPFLSSRP